MQLTVEWSAPLTLRDALDEGLIYSFNYAKIDPEPGVYVFGRVHGSTFEALYVGKGDDLQRRTKGQLKNLKLMLHLKGARNGTRIVFAGVFKARRGQQSGRCLPILERALIRHFLSEGHDLVNVQGTRIRRHEITTSGSKHMPSLMFVDRGRGE